jgi:hypothetical protein
MMMGLRPVPMKKQKNEARSPGRLCALASGLATRTGFEEGAMAMKKSVWMLTGLLACSAWARAAAPGPIDGLSIPSDFANSVELSVQTNNTGFGNQIIESGDFTPGSELDGLFLAKDANFLYVGVTGNLERNGHAFVIFIDVDDNFGLFGQSELRAEGVGGPPFAVQTASREVSIDTNGTPGDGSDDTWMYGSNGTMLPCAPDYAIAVDVFSGTMSISEYTLFDPVFVGPAGTTDPTPDNPNDPLQQVFAVREFIGQSPINDGNDIIENLQPGNPYGPGGFDDTNTSGVTDATVVDAALATTGLEIGMPLSRFLGATNIQLFVVLVDGGGSTGAFVPQSLPPTLDAAACTSEMAFPLRADLSTALACMPLDLATLPTFTGLADGSIDPSEYGGVTTDLQDCPTPYGDQQFDPDAAVPTGGSELNVMYADNDADRLYIGLTGNVERGGNTLHVFIDTDPDGADLGTNGRESDGMGGWVGIDTDFVPFQALKGLTGDALPEDIDSNAVNWNLAFGINIDGGNNNTYVDLWDLANKTGGFLGSSQFDSGSGVLSGGTNPFGVEVAYNSQNQVGIDGNCFDAASCLEMTTNGSGAPAQVEAAARSSTRGFEFSIPWEALDIDPQALPERVHVWAYVTGSGPGGFGSNQSLPPMRPRSNNALDSMGSPIRHMVSNAGNGPNDYSDGQGAPDRQFDAFAAVYFVQVPGDCDGDGDVDLLDYVCFESCLLGPDSGLGSGCGPFDIDGDGDVDLADFAGFQGAFTLP